MATIVGYPCFEMTEEERKALVAKVPRAVVDAFELDINISAMMLMESIPDECHGPSCDGQIIYFIYTAPNKTDEQKRRMVKGVYDATVESVGYKGKGKVVIIIKEHTDENCGVDGVWRVDAKRNGTFHV